MKKILLLFIVLYSVESVSQSVVLDISGKYTIKSSPCCYYWSLKYKPTGSTTYSGTGSMGINSNATLILNPFISWDFQRGSLTQDGQSTHWDEPFTFNAEYKNISKSVGYTYNFDGNDVDEGWRGYTLNYNNSIYYGIAEISNKYNYTHNNSPQSIELVSGANNQNVLVSPKLTDLSSDKKFSIYLNVEDVVYSTYIELGTIKDPYDPSTFHPLKKVYIDKVGGFQKIDVFFNNYISNDNYIAIKTPGDSSDIILDDFSYEQSVNCFDLSNLDVTNITENAAQINFDASPEQNKWELSLKNVTNGDTQIIPVNQNPFQLQNLSGNTKYEIQLRANCDTGLYSNPTPIVSFTTPCTSLTPGYYTGFDEYSYLNPCWSRIVQTSSDVWLYDNDSSIGFGAAVASSGKKCIMFDSTWTDAKSYLVTPYISDLDNTKRIRFKLYDHKRFNFLNHAVVIGTLADPKDTSTFIPIETLDPTKINPIGIYEFGSFWQQFIIDFKNYNIGNNHHYIAFRFDATAAPIDELVFLDDFYYEEIPNYKEPTNLQVLTYEYNKVTISWDTNNDVSKWQIQYGPSGFDIGTGKIITVKNSPFTINSDLIPGTSYDFYIRSVYADGASAWSSKGYFKTGCEGVSVGYTHSFEDEDFENNTTCWRRLTPLVRSYYRNPGFYMDIYNNSYKQYTSFTAHTGTQHVVLRGYENSNNEQDKTILVSPRLIDFNNNSKISFWAYSENINYSSPQSIIIGTLSDPNDYTSFVPFQTITAPDHSWEKYTIDFSGYNGSDQYIGIKQAFSNAYFSIALDDFEYLGNPCRKPTSLVAEQTGEHSVTLAWDSNLTDTSNGWQIEYGAYGFTPGTGTVLTIDKSPYVLNGLGTYNTYQFRVRNICSNGFVNWSDVYSFKVSCLVTVPFYETFDQYDATSSSNVYYPGGIPDFCWTSNNFFNGGIKTYYLHNINSSPNAGFVDHSYSDADGMIISPYLADFDNKKRIKFWVNSPYNKNLNPNLKLLVGTLKNPLDPSSFQVYQSISMKDIPVYGKEIVIDFSKYTGTDNHIAFKTEGYEYDILVGNDIFIDNVYYDTIPDCYEPIDVVFQNTDSNSTLIKWQKGPDSNVGANISIEYGLSGFVIGTGTIVTADSNEILIEGLQASSTYDFYFRTICDNGNSPVAGPKKAKTPCNVYPLPWIEKLDGLGQYGLNMLPDCFGVEIGEGYITSYNVPLDLSWTQSFDYDHILKGYDDDTYLRLFDNFYSSLFTPQYNLKAGVTYKFSLKARKSYQYEGMGILVSVGRSKETYAMESDLPAVGTISEYQYNDVAFYYTPMETGNYNYLMRFSDSGGLNMIVDDLKLDEGYKSTVNGAHLFDFNNGIDDALIIEETATSDVNLVNVSGKKVLKMNGSVTSEYKDSDNPWLANQNNVTKINFKVNASSSSEKMSASLYLRFKLKQTYRQSQHESAFRVVINGKVVGDVIYPKTSNQDGFEIHQIDLSPYKGEDLRVSLQHIGKSEYSSGIGDNAFVGDIEISSEELSINEFDFSNLVAYPNPTKNTIRLEGNNISKVQAFNISGQNLLDVNTNGDNIEIDLSKYSVGVYFIKAFNGERSKVLKVVKE